MSDGTDRVERCNLCDEPTGRAGACEDSMYCDQCGNGPLCERCYRDHGTVVDALLTATKAERDRFGCELDKAHRHADLIEQSRDDWKRRAGEATEALRKCETCDGDGVMSVVKGYSPHEGEILDDVVCAECDGAGVSSWGQAIDRADKAESELTDLRAKLEAVEGENARFAKAALKEWSKEDLVLRDAVVVWLRRDADERDKGLPKTVTSEASRMYRSAAAFLEIVNEGLRRRPAPAEEK